MRILHLAPLWFPVSRDAPGGIETYLPGLLSALGKLGCQCTLLASGDSSVEAELAPVIPRNLCAEMEAGTAAEYAYFEQHQLLLALELATEFDVVHSHIGGSAYVLSGVPGLGARVLHTQHNPVYPDQEWFVSRHPDLWFSTVSEFQARKICRLGASRCQVIPNGLDVTAFTYQPRGGDGLFFLGRMEEEKGPDIALRLARTLGRPLVLAGPIVDEAFFDRAIKPYLDDRIRYVGVVDHRRKNELFGQAGCVVMPSRVEEGFGMVSIEAMACGTPVVALGNGALPEIVEPGVTGYLASTEEGLAVASRQAFALDRAAIRDRVGARFDLPRIAERYCRLYENISTAAKA